LFPLQYRPEASTLVHARYYNDDYETLRNIAFSLPMDARLLVKEHPAAIGVRDSHFYRRLKELPGVQLAAPDWPLREHLDAISAVVCLTSTLGFEALQAGLPVLMLGRAFYEDYPGVLRVQSWDQLFHALRELPKLTTRHPRPEILQRYANVCFEGRFNYMSRDSLEPDNIVQLAQPLLQAVHGKAAERESRK
jgi:capsule polysaccharide modification protein KpsS